MGLRFRRSVKVFPGVRLNFSSRGISTTVGTRGASINVGPRGTFLNAGIPGSGVSARVRLDSPTPPPPHTIAPVIYGRPELNREIPLTLISPPGEIASSSNDEVTSPGLGEFRSWLAESFSESLRLRSERPAISAQAARATIRAKAWESGFFLRRILPGKFQGILQEAKSAQAELTELQQQIEACALRVDVQVPPAVRDRFSDLLHAFERLSRTAVAWDVTSEVGIDSVRQRSAASSSVTRTRIVPCVRGTDLIRFEGPALCLPNANGSDLYLYPGFLLLYRNPQNFGLVAVPDVDVHYSDTTFIEEEGVPRDTKVIGETWKYVNKNGSPDRRFSYNPRIPVVAYGTLRLSSAGGLNEEFMFSDAAAAGEFAKRFAALRSAYRVEDLVS